MTLQPRLDAEGGLESISDGRVDSLTGIRAVAAILVVLTHAAYTTGKYTHGYVGLVFSRMEIGVPIFFVLSGFLVVSLLLEEDRFNGTIGWLAYAGRRLRRGMPAKLAFLVAEMLAKD